MALSCIVESPLRTCGAHLLLKANDHHQHYEAARRKGVSTLPVSSAVDIPDAERCTTSTTKWRNCANTSHRDTCWDRPSQSRTLGRSHRLLFFEEPTDSEILHLRAVKCHFVLYLFLVNTCFHTVLTFFNQTGRHQASPSSIRPRSRTGNDFVNPSAAF